MRKRKRESEIDGATEKKNSRVREKVLPRKVFNWEKLFFYLCLFALFSIIVSFFSLLLPSHLPLNAHVRSFVGSPSLSPFSNCTFYLFPFDSNRKKKEKSFCSMTISVSHFEWNKQKKTKRINKQTNKQMTRTIEKAGRNSNKFLCSTVDNIFEPREGSETAEKEIWLQFT